MIYWFGVKKYYSQKYDYSITILYSSLERSNSGCNSRSSLTSQPICTSQAPLRRSTLIVRISWPMGPRGLKLSCKGDRAQTYLFHSTFWQWRGGVPKSWQKTPLMFNIPHLDVIPQLLPNLRNKLNNPPRANHRQDEPWVRTTFSMALNLWPIRGTNSLGKRFYLIFCDRSCASCEIYWSHNFLLNPWQFKFYLRISE